jgi:hypothetical protein
MAWLSANAYERNLPIAAPARSAKTLMTIYDVYLSDKLLARDGQLPNYNDAKRRARNLTYLVKNPKAYRGKVFQDLLTAGCVLEIRRNTAPITKRGYADTKRTEPLPARCDELLREQTRQD